MLRRLLTSAVIAGALAAVAPVVANASNHYCQWDPPVVVVTPAGNLDVVYVDVASPFGNVSEGVVSDQTSRAYDSSGRPYTVVTMKIWVPSNLLTGAYPVQDTVSSGLLGSGTVYAEAGGMSGQTLGVQFSLSTP